MMRKVKDLVNADRCTVFLIDEERRELWSSLAEGAPEIRIPLKTGIAGYVAQSIASSSFDSFAKL